MPSFGVEASESADAGGALPAFAPSGSSEHPPHDACESDDQLDRLAGDLAAVEQVLTALDSGHLDRARQLLDGLSAGMPELPLDGGSDSAAGGDGARQAADLSHAEHGGTR